MNTAEATARLTEMAAEAEAMKQAAGGCVTAVAAEWVGAQYLLALQRQLATLPPDDPERFALLRQAAGDVAALQRGSILAARLQIEREKLEFQRQKQRDKAAAEQAVQQRRDPNEPMTDEELKACVDKVDEIFGLKPMTRKTGDGGRKAEDGEAGGPAEGERP